MGHVIGRVVRDRRLADGGSPEAVGRVPRAGGSRRTGRTGRGASRSAACPERSGSRPASGTLASSSGRSARGRGSRSAAARDPRSLCLAGMRSRVGVRGVSAHRIVRINPRLSIPGCNHVRVVADSGVAVEHAVPGVRRWLVARPGLFELLSTAERVVHVAAPAGSGKTFLLRSWIAAEGLGDRAAWVSVGRQEHDPQAFWLSVLDSLRGRGSGPSGCGS